MLSSCLCTAEAVTFSCKQEDPLVAPVSILQLQNMKACHKYLQPQSRFKGPRTEVGQVVEAHVRQIWGEQKLEKKTPKKGILAKSRKDGKSNGAKANRLLLTFTLYELDISASGPLSPYTRLLNHIYPLVTFH